MKRKESERLAFDATEFLCKCPSLSVLPLAFLPTATTNMGYKVRYIAFELDCTLRLILSRTLRPDAMEQLMGLKVMRPSKLPMYAWENRTTIDPLEIWKG
jgi:hypothetical protein